MVFGGEASGQIKKAARRGAALSKNRSSNLRAVDAFSLQALWTSLYFKLNLRAFFECPIAGHLDGREVDKHIFAAGPLDESIAFGGVKPFHYTLFSHCFLSPVQSFFARSASQARECAIKTPVIFSWNIHASQPPGTSSTAEA
jgi:hypothetical protein